MVTLTNEELANLAPEERKAHFAAEERLVFGQTFRRAKGGTPIEQGIGSPGHETLNHFAALEAAERLGFEEPGTAKRLRDEAKARSKKRGA